MFKRSDNAKFKNSLIFIIRLFSCHDSIEDLFQEKIETIFQSEHKKVMSSQNEHYIDYMG